MNEQRIWQRLSEAIENKYGVAGLMGNLYAESALNPENLQQSYEKKLGYTDATYTNAVDDGTYTNFVNDSAGYGLAQWTYWSRKEKLLKRAREMGVSIGDLEMQLDYLIEELGAYNLIYKLNTAKSVREASDIVLTQYEKPANQGESVKQKRAGYGQKYYDMFEGGVANMATVKVGSARIDENGRATGGKAGDQTGKEVSTQNWYKHTKGWRVFRAKSETVANKIAQDMQWACDNSHIGYDQGQRLTLYNVAKPLGFDCSRVTQNCETDCSALVRVCCAYAGIMLANFRTTNEPQVLLDSGAFVEMKGTKYTNESTYLKRGDILCTKTQGHTVVVLNNGPKAEIAPVDGLSRGDSGAAVKEMQEALLGWYAGCLPKYGADGDFGYETESAVKAFQGRVGLPVTGIYDDATKAALLNYGKGQYVIVTGDSVYVRTAPNTSSPVLGIVHENHRLPYQGQDSENGWHLVEYDKQNAWISGKYSEVET